MVVFAISLFGTTLPHIFYGESLLNHMNTMQGRGPLVAYPTHSHLNSSMLQDNATSNLAMSEMPANLCINNELGSPFLNRPPKSEWDNKLFIELVINSSSSPFTSYPQTASQRNRTMPLSLSERLYSSSSQSASWAWEWDRRQCLRWAFRTSMTMWRAGTRPFTLPSRSECGSWALPLASFSARSAHVST